MSPWGPNLEQPLTPGRPHELAWFRRFSGVELHHTLTFKGIGGEATSIGVPVQNAILHAVIDGLPHSAYPELLEQLKTLWLFYSDEDTPKELPAPVRKTKVKITKRYDQPSYSIPAED